MAAAGARNDVDRAPRRAVFAGASAGGVEALAELVSTLPPDFPAPMLVVLHMGPSGASVLPDILTRAGALLAVAAADGEPLRAGTIYIAPRDIHMTVRNAHVRLSTGPAEHSVRPAIDPLFRSAARVYGARAIGVVLSGMLDDGTSGLREIKRAGGVAIAQEPSSTAFPDMPSSAIEHVALDHVLTPSAIGALLDTLVRAPTPARSAATAEQPRDAGGEETPRGMRTDLVCPTCGDLLWEQTTDDLALYRCRSRHVFTAGTLLAVQSQNLEASISQPLRALRERGALLERLARRAEERAHAQTADRFHTQALHVHAQADALERAIRGERRDAILDHDDEGRA